jgi:hypothetical protein
LPRKRRRGIAKRNLTRIATLSAELTEWAGSGHTTWQIELAYTDTDKCALWAAVAPEFLEAWIAEYPGTRPFAWWCYSSTPLPERHVRIVHGSLEGTTERLVRVWGHRMLPRELALEAESQATYLRRHHLLVPSEVNALYADDYDDIVLESGAVETFAGE